MGLVVSALAALHLHHWLAVFCIALPLLLALRPRNNNTKGPTKEDSEKKNRNKKQRTDDEIDDDEKPALNSDLPHIPFQHRGYPEPEMVSRSAQFYREMNQRRSLRFYSSRPVPLAVMENLILAAGTAPSGAHTEPWTYVLVSDIRTKQQVRDIIEREEEVSCTRTPHREYIRLCTQLY